VRFRVAARCGSGWLRGLGGASEVRAEGLRRHSDQRRRYGPFLTGAIARSTLAAIDGEELEDRLHQASQLIAKAQQAPTPGQGKRLGEEAQRILGARPRAETEAIVVAKMARARILAPHDRGRAADLEQQARDELLAHQPAVRRRGSNGQRIAKASAKPEPGPSGLIALYDSAGNIAYAINADSPDLIPVTSMEDAGVVTKARRQTPRPQGGR
jgi:hypothetical protein